jgi:hypothetical protein
MELGIKELLTIGGIVLSALLIVGIQGATYLIRWIRSLFPNQSIAKGGDPKGISRSADEPATSGMVDYIKDIAEACGTAPAEFVLEQLKTGVSRDIARANRIRSLESPAGVKVEAK